MNFKNKKVDWKHLANLLWFFEDIMGWYYILLAFLILIFAFSWVTGLILVACITLKLWAVNWERKQWM